jgi:hypothetical protein
MLKRSSLPGNEGTGRRGPGRKWQLQSSPYPNALSMGLRHPRWGPRLGARPGAGSG